MSLLTAETTHSSLSSNKHLFRPEIICNDPEAAIPLSYLRAPFSMMRSKEELSKKNTHPMLSKIRMLTTILWATLV